MTRLFEYQSKLLLRNKGIPVPLGEVARTPLEARTVAEKISKPVVIKAQVGVTGRFKAGGIMFANNPDEAEYAAKEIIGKNIKGQPVKEVLVEERLDIKHEFYAGIIVDDSYKVKGPVLIISTSGGVDIEEIASKSPEKVVKLNVNILEGVKEENIISLTKTLYSDLTVCQQLAETVCKLYSIFREYELRSIETNPLVLAQNNLLIAADCRIILDESAIFRHPELGHIFPRDLGRPPTRLEKIAWKIEENDYRGIAYFAQMVEKINPYEGYIGFHGIGGGAAMLGADALIRQGLKLANYADTSGNPTASKVYRIIKTIFAQPNIEGYILMGAVMANQEQWHHANALVKALREELANRPAFPVILLLAGNKETEALEILREGLKGLPAEIEIYGREYVYRVDEVAKRMKELIEKYRVIKQS
ncbi:MAG: ATP-grasp domain-containing protein [Nitrososphaeria archaeon]